MTENTAEALLTMERLVIAEKAGVREVIQAAYQLGNFDGKLEMAMVGHKTKEPA